MRKIFTIVFCSLFLFSLNAQDGHFTQVYQNPLYLNPALVGGNSNTLRIGGIYRSQWQAINAKYGNYSFFIDGKIKNFAIGFLSNQSKAGITGYKKSNALLALGYRKPLGDGYNSLSIGAQIGLNQVAIDPNQLSYDNQYNPEIGFDEDLLSGENFSNGIMKARDINIGIAYNFDVERSVPILGEVGLAFYHVNAPKMTSFFGEQISFPTKLVLHGKAFFHLSESFGVEPMLFLAKQKTATEIAGGVNFGFNMSDSTGFKLGVGYRLKDAFLFKAQFNIKKLTLGIGFDYTISKLRQANGSSNAMEISMIYNIPLKIQNREMLDTDGDGIIDRRDECPKVPGIASLKGCPEELDEAKEPISVLGQDYDKDGILDDNDLCPYEFGYVQFQGCNDQDADGIWDHIDVCPSLPGKIENHGCPVEIPGIDSDNDGIPDRFDRCIYIKGVEAFQGCPDTDDDGISDLEDDCPYVKGTRAGNGCPENKMTKSGFGRGEELSIDVVEFDTDKHRVKSQYFFMLDRVAKMLINERHYKLVIEGHTDNEGNASYNFQLSQKRSNAVKNYLIEKGAPSGAIEIHYFGETKPKDENENSYGKARNRRAELMLFETQH